jgi:AcrR family transcriptional regulator
VTQQPARTYGGRTREERDTDRRERMRASALALFGEEGYASVPIERLCSHAKVSTRHFYQLYDSKESVLLDVYGQITSAAFSKVAASLEETAGRPIEERMRAAVRAYLSPMLETPMLARIAFVEIVGVSPRVEENRLQFRASIVALVEEEGRLAVERGEIEDRDFRFAALAFSGAVNVVVHDWSLSPNHKAADTLAQQLSDLLVLLALR